jgi:hypothetical protein
MITIHDLLTEMQSFCTIAPEQLEKAQKSEITTKNNKTFRELSKGWVLGRYDEDPQAVVQEIETLLS